MARAQDGEIRIVVCATVMPDKSVPDSRFSDTGKLAMATPRELMEAMKDGGYDFTAHMLVPSGETLMRVSVQPTDLETRER